MSNQEFVIKPIIDSRIKPGDIHPATLLQMAAVMMFKSAHPYAHALIAEAEKDGRTIIKDVVKDFDETPEGITGLIAKNSEHGTRFYLGNKDYVLNSLDISGDQIDSQIESYEKAGDTVLYFANSERLLGYIVISKS